ncbi:acetolactate decarboxylase [Gloeobacter morelensis]|uniref:Alpha-acetolactate decarboxylase n=1 Tax=Gloeobacter morelensis MG652769 TaxID=2781736 RepID=A0ABY3PH32_9CYAN|nr:acetolactate decarboxylase [Gloeobacter morelensis]UFP92944.1 acetolactate decarboxylase [Gloeobacter morelensis MG652769]
MDIRKVFVGDGSKKRKKLKGILLLSGLTLVGAVTLSAFSVPNSVSDDVVFQASTADALYSSVFDGYITYGKLKRNGDFGLGAPDHIDGEIMAIDGKYYQSKTDGTVRETDDAETVSWATVKFFKPEKSFDILQPIDCEDFKATLDKKLPTVNVFYAIKVVGVFDSVQYQNFPRMEKPYASFSEGLANAVNEEVNNVEGTFMGFRFPEKTAPDLNVPQYHLHLLTNDKQNAGHINTCKIRRARVYIDAASQLKVDLPNTLPYYQSPLDGEVIGSG